MKIKLLAILATVLCLTYTPAILADTSNLQTMPAPDASMQDQQDAQTNEDMTSDEANKSATDSANHSQTDDDATPDTATGDDDY